MSRILLLGLLFGAAAVALRMPVGHRADPLFWVALALPLWCAGVLLRARGRAQLRELSFVTVAVATLFMVSLLWYGAYTNQLWAAAVALTWLPILQLLPFVLIHPNRARWVALGVLLFYLFGVVAVNGPLTVLLGEDSLWGLWMHVLIADFTLVSLTYALALRAKQMHLAVGVGAGAIVKMRAELELDPLTGVANRRALDTRLSELRDAASPDEPFSVVVLDIDNFKHVNDTYGHQAGDRVLREVATRLGEHLREHDLLGRYGGEEFVAILPGTTLRRAALVAEEMRAVLERGGFGVRGGTLRVTGSFGVAFSEGQEDPADIFRRADVAMYRAKGSGKNRVEIEPVCVSDPVASAPDA